MDVTSPNFSFLGAHDAQYVRVAASAESHCLDDPIASLAKLRTLGEMLAEAERARREDRDYETAEELLKRVEKKTTRVTDTTASKSDGEDSTEVNENGQIEMKMAQNGNPEL